MNVNVQPVNNQNQGQQGGQSPVDNLIEERQNQFPISDDPFDSDWGLDFDEETGKIKITGGQKAITPAPASTGIATSTDDQVVAERQTNNNSQQQASSADEKIARLEGVVQQLIGVVTGMVANPGNSNNLNQGDQQQTQYDLSDHNQMAAYINQSIQQAMKPMMDLLPKIVERVTYQDARGKYGKDFDEAQPFIAEMMAGGGLTHDAAFQLYQKMKASFGQSANTHGASQNQPPRQQGTAEALISKANRVQTQTGVNGSLANGKPQINGVRDALNAAYEELSGGY